ncbi:MAG: hypothetical protein NZ899_05800 [Thermoguttaceae bacterium]|nr:hypothetical protein [Thermoguttaceae bacterium]MDW8079454.1 hypothetical protein [Thermoguttaceae bacterium]
MVPWSGVVFVCAALAVCLVLGGCSQGGRASAPMQESTIKPLGLLYGQFMGQHQGRPPASEEEFKQFVRERGMGMLKQFNVPDVESLFVSPRDKQPYVVIYGEIKGPPALAGQPVIAYERQGVGGKRFVANSLGAVEEVDETKFRELVPQ